MLSLLLKCLRIKQQQIFPPAYLSSLCPFLFFFFSRSRGAGFDLYGVILTHAEQSQKYNMNTRIMGMNLPYFLGGGRSIYFEPFFHCTVLVTHLISVELIYL